MYIDDTKFDELLTAAFYRAAELDYGDMPSDKELDEIVQPSTRFQRKMKALLRNPNKYTRNLRRPIYFKMLQNVAAVTVVVTTILGATIAVSPTARAAVIGFVRSWFEDRTAYWTSEENVEREWVFSYIPDGFELIIMQDAEVGSFHVYQNDAMEMITIAISSGKTVVDNEHSEYYQTAINNRLVDVYESDSPLYPNIIVIYDDMTDNLITISSEIDLNMLIMIAEGIG